MNLIEFKPDGSVIAEPVVATPENLAAFHRSLILVFTGRARQGNDEVLAKQSESVASGTNTDAMTEMRDLAYEMRELLAEGDIESIGRLLHRNWELKRAAAPGTSTSEIDELYASARDAGAWGGKLLGAGGGGFFLVCAPPIPTPRCAGRCRTTGRSPSDSPAQGTHLLLLERD